MNPAGDVRKTVEIGGYRVIRKIGQGAMGAVYLARHIQLDTEVALKILDKEQMRKEAQRLRFVQEGQLAARIDHPNVVRVFNSGTEAGRCYIAMEYVEGMSLSDKIERDGTFTPADVVRTFVPIAHALAAAHARGIIHRDVKPGNILLGRDGAIKITDFGLAREVDGDANITQAGAVMGSPAYMSPEQAKGERVTPQTDVFSLGISLYACLCGESPFFRGNAMASLVAVMREELPPLAEKRPDVPAPLAKLVEHMAAKDPDRRPAGMEVVAASLELIAGGIAAKAAGTPANAASGVRGALRPASGERAAVRPTSGERVRAAPTPKGEHPRPTVASTSRDLANAAAPPTKIAPARPLAKPTRPRSGAARARPPSEPVEDDPNQPIRVRRRLGISFELSLPSWLLPGLGLLMFGLGIWLVSRVLKPITPIDFEDESKAPKVVHVPTKTRTPPGASDRQFQRRIDFARQVVPQKIQARQWAEAWNALSELRVTDGWPPELAERAKAVLADLEGAIQAPLLGSFGEWENRALQARTADDIEAVRGELARLQDYSIAPIVAHKAKLLAELDQRVYEAALEGLSRALDVGRRLDGAWRYISLVETGHFDALRERFADDPRADLLERFALIETAWRADLVARAGDDWTSLMLEDGEEVKVRFIKDRESGDVVECEGQSEKTRFSELAKRLAVPPLAKVIGALDALEGKPEEGRRELAAGVYLRHHEIPGAIDHFKAARAALDRDGDRRQLAAMDRYLKLWPDVLRALSR